MCQLYVCMVPCLEELLKVHLESIFELIRSILSHYVLPGSSKTKKASVPLNRAILGPPLPYPTVLLDERIPERNEKGCRHWENSIVATICDRNHCIGPYHRLLADATPRKVSKRRKKLVTKKVDSFVLFKRELKLLALLHLYNLGLLLSRFSQICKILCFFRHKLMPLQA